MFIRFNEEELRASQLLLDFMETVQDWGLNCNADELARHIHGLQLFVMMHMLQRGDPDGWSKWYGEEA